MVEQNKQIETYNKSVAASFLSAQDNVGLKMKQAINAIPQLVRDQWISRHPEFEGKLDTISEKDVENTNTTFSIQEDDFMSALGHEKGAGKYYSKTQVYTMLHKLSKMTIGFDALGIAKDIGGDIENIESFTNFIASAGRENGHYKIHMSPKLVHMLINPKVAFAGAKDWKGIKSKYSPELMDMAMMFHQRGEVYTDWFHWTYLKMMWAGSLSIPSIGKFNEKCIKVAMEDINNNDNFHLKLDVEFGGEELDAKDETNVKQRNKKGAPKKVYVRFKITPRQNKIEHSYNSMIGFGINAQKPELSALGIAKNQLDLVIGECEIDGVISLSYLKFCIKKGHSILTLKKNFDLSINSFGAVFRKTIIREEKENWIRITNVIKKHLIATYDNLPVDRIQLTNLIDDTRIKLRKDIRELYLSELSEHVTPKLFEEYETFLAVNFVEDSKHHHENNGGKSLRDLSGRGEYLLDLFLDHEYKIFTVDSYINALATKKLHDNY